jgi:hypothetical protein
MVTPQGGGVMITSGWSWDALTYGKDFNNSKVKTQNKTDFIVKWSGAFPGGPNDEYPYDLTYYEYGGLGFLPGFILDTHFRFEIYCI